MPAAGDTFILTRETRGTPHLWVLLWGPVGPADVFLAAHLSTWREGRDRSCLVQAGEHPFVKHETYVVYNDTKRFSAAVLQAAIGARQAFPGDPVSPALLERMRAGFLASPFTPHAMIQFARETFGAS
jgi:hypothetical protein